MALELHVVLRDHYVKTTCSVLYLNQFQDLHVVLRDLGSQHERCHIDNVDIGVFESENACNLCIFALFVLLETQASQFRDAERVDVDFNATTLLDVRPTLFEFVLHLIPHFE